MARGVWEFYERRGTGRHIQKGHGFNSVLRVFMLEVNLVFTDLEKMCFNRLDLIEVGIALVAINMIK